MREAAKFLIDRGLMHLHEPAGALNGEIHLLFKPRELSARQAAVSRDLSVPEPEPGDAGITSLATAILVHDSGPYLETPEQHEDRLVKITTDFKDMLRQRGKRALLNGLEFWLAPAVGKDTGEMPPVSAIAIRSTSRRATQQVERLKLELQKQGIPLLGPVEHLDAIARNWLGGFNLLWQLHKLVYPEAHQQRRAPRGT